MSSDHEDAPFEALQKLRAVAERETDKIVLNWALHDAPSSMTLEQVRNLRDVMRHNVNHQMRQVYDSFSGKK